MCQRLLGLVLGTTGSLWLLGSSLGSLRRLVCQRLLGLVLGTTGSLWLLGSSLGSLRRLGCQRLLGSSLGSLICWLNRTTTRTRPDGPRWLLPSPSSSACKYKRQIFF